MKDIDEKIEEESPLDIIEMEDNKSISVKTKRSPGKKTTKCGECALNKDKLTNVERVVNQMDKELNYWVSTYKENKEHSDLLIRTIMSDIIKPLVKDNADMTTRMNEMRTMIEEQEQLIHDIRTQLRNEIKSNKVEMKCDLTNFEIDVTKVKRENEDIAKEQLKLHQKIHMIQQKKKEEIGSHKNELKETSSNDYKQITTQEKDNIVSNSNSKECFHNAENRNTVIKDTNDEGRDVIINNSNKGRKKLTILMDSNRKYINFKELFTDRDIEVLKCGSTESVNKVIKNKKIVSDEVLIHVGINDIEVEEPNVVAMNIVNIAKNLKNKHKLYISEITMRNDHLATNVSMTNALVKQKLQKEIEEEEIILITHKNINSHELLFDKKHLNKNRKNNSLSGVEKLSINFYNNIDRSNNGIEKINLMRRNRIQNYRNQQPMNNYSNPNYARHFYKKERMNNEYNKLNHISENSYLPNYMERYKKQDMRFVNNYFIPSKGCLGTLV